ncbi:MAG TPA: DNA methyltransferase [Candidatus Angelobacter sp.]|nr:DNA methyltransferase [Candidatus Angelobacter sp.]
MALADPAPFSGSALQSGPLVRCHEMQSTLFGAPAATNGFRDPSFTKNKSLPLHRWVPWVAGFSADFVQDCISNYLPNATRDSWVLDPFSGVGTTLVEAYLAGINVVGFEINPYAALATKTKLKALQISVYELGHEIAKFERFMERANDGSLKRSPRTAPPSGFNGRTQLFSPRVERKVLYALDFIEGIENRTIKDIFRLGLGSVMISFSNYSYEPSLTRRSAVNKPNIEDANVGLSLSAKLRLMLEDIGWTQGHMKRFGYRPRTKVIPTSVVSALKVLNGGACIDLVVTSPPYLNNYHYPRNTRPQLHWLGFAEGSGYKGARETSSFGKFWQTVRDSSAINLDFAMPELCRIVETVRERNRDKGAYGGPGWANYIATYFNDTHAFCQTLQQLLRPGAVAVVVLGNSIIQGVEVKTDYFFGRIAEFANLRFENTHLLRKKRTGSSIIQSSVRVDQAADKAALYESAIVLRKAS